VPSDWTIPVSSEAKANGTSRNQAAAPSRYRRHAPSELLAGQAEDGESEEYNDSAEPTDRGSDMRRERELAMPGGMAMAVTDPLPAWWRACGTGPRVATGAVPPGLNSRMTNDRNTMKARIPNTVTQRGAPGYRGRSAMAQDFIDTYCLCQYDLYRYRRDV